MRHLMCRIVGDLSDSRVNQITSIMYEVCHRANLDIVGQTTHKYKSQGFSLILVLTESHLSIHTFPELGFATIDYFTCAGIGSNNEELAEQKVNTVLDCLGEYFDIPDNYLSVVRR